jgi:hypothetical protein
MFHRCSLFLERIDSPPCLVQAIIFLSQFLCLLDIEKMRLTARCLWHQILVWLKALLHESSLLLQVNATNLQLLLHLLKVNEFVLPWS